MAPAILAVGVAVHTGRGATWSPINTGLPSAPINVASIVIAPKTPSTLYANTRSPDGVGGIFKTTDGALTWKAISSVVGVNSIVVDPNDSSTLYVLTTGGVRKSANGGESWISAGVGLPDTYVSALAIDPITSTTLYAVAGGIFKSTDGGASWNALNTGFAPNTYINSLLIDPLTPSRIYVIANLPQPGAPPAAVLVRSADGGESWTVLDTGLLPNSTIRSVAIAPSTSSVIYATVYPDVPGGGSSSAILKSVDGGESWNRINTGLPSGASVGSLAIDPKNSSAIYIVVVFPFAEAGGILKSTDGGATWTAINQGLPADTPIQSLAIDPVASSTLYIIADGNILKSTDGGTRWIKATTGLTAIDVRTLAMSRVDASTVYIGAGDSVHKTVDGGGSWTRLNAFQLSVSSASNFIPSPFPEGAPAYPASLLIDFVNPDVLYAATTRGNGCYYADNLLFKTTDGGMTWTDSVSPDKSGCVLGGLFSPSAGLKAMDPTDPNTLYLAEADDEDGGWSLLRSKDGGASWNSIGNFLDDVQAGVWALAIDPANPATLYAGLDDVPQYSDSGDIQPGQGGVFKSTDGGASWNSIGLSGSAVNLLVIDPTHPGVLYAGTEGNYGSPKGFRGLFKSTDSGATWSPVNNGLDGVLGLGFNLTAIVIDQSNSTTLYAGTAGGGVFKSSDGGANWSPLSDGLANLDVRGLAIAPSSVHALYAATSGGVFKIIDDTQ